MPTSTVASAPGRTSRQRCAMGAPEIGSLAPQISLSGTGESSGIGECSGVPVQRTAFATFDNVTDQSR